MCPCLGSYICGYHAERIREGLADIHALPAEQQHDALEALGTRHGRDRVNLIANLGEVVDAA